jgi:hypothetical protein
MITLLGFDKRHFFHLGFKVIDVKSNFYSFVKGKHSMHFQLRSCRSVGRRPVLGRAQSTWGNNANGDNEDDDEECTGGSDGYEPIRLCPGLCAGR